MFYRPELIRRLAECLNYWLVRVRESACVDVVIRARCVSQLAGKEAAELKVSCRWWCVTMIVITPRQVRANVGFTPKRLLWRVTSVLTRLGEHSTAFCEALASDARSYSDEVYRMAAHYLERHQIGKQSAAGVRVLCVCGVGNMNGACVI
jgi:hypothetical protein